jgi:hypothetical protein
MAILKNQEGIRINGTNSTNTGYGSRIYTSTRTWAAFASGINMLQIYQNGATSTRQTFSISLRWAAIRTSGSKTELPALFATARASLNTDGNMTFDNGLDWASWGGNGILWPYAGMGGSSLFIGANSGSSTGIIGSVHVTLCTMSWDNVIVNVFSD